MAELDWHHMPSLTALRAFEAMARLGSFSAAARALNVTHAAVAQQVRGLEDRLGVALAYRDGRSMALTPEGALLAAALLDGFSAIQSGVRELQSRGADQPLRISVTPAFATLWLMPRLGRFWAKHADVPISLHPDRELVDLRRDGMDLAIRFGKGDWPGVEVEYLLSAEYAVVAAPKFLDGRVPTVEDMKQMPWVAETRRPETLNWLRSQGFDPDTLDITYIPTDELAYAAACQGYGLYVEPVALADEDLRLGKLEVVYSNDARLPAYFLVTRPGVVKPALRTFVHWIRSEA